MDALERRVEVIGGLRYSVEKSALIASDLYWDGSNWERHGRNTYLYLTPGGRYFIVTRTQWQGEDDGALRPLEVEEAQDLWEELRVREVSYEEAFPGVTVEDA